MEAEAEAPGQRTTRLMPSFIVALLKFKISPTRKPVTFRYDSTWDVKSGIRRSVALTSTMTVSSTIKSGL